jgi:hypothetical protein
MLKILKQIFDNLRLRYYTSLYFKELKIVANSSFETTKDFAIKMGFPAMSKIFEITREIQRSRFNCDITYEQFLDMFYTVNFNNPETKHWMIRKYGINTWKLFLRAGGLEQEEKSIEAVEERTSIKSVTSKDYADEIKKHLHNFDCQFTAQGYLFALALKQDRSAIDQAVIFFVTAIVDHCLQLDFIRSVTEGSVHIREVSNKIKNYYENGQISNLAYQSVISILGTYLNPKRTNEEQAVLESLKNQNYLEGKQLVFIAS